MESSSKDEFCNPRLILKNNISVDKSFSLETQNKLMKSWPLEHISLCSKLGGQDHGLPGNATGRGLPGCSNDQPSHAETE